MKNYQDLFIDLKNGLGEDFKADIERTEYIGELEILGRYKNKKINIRNLDEESVTIEYSGHVEELDELIPIVSSYMEKSPLCSFDVITFSTLMRQSARVEWNDPKELDNILNNRTIGYKSAIENIKTYDQEETKKLIKK